MRTQSLKKGGHNRYSDEIRWIAQSEGIPEFMVRLARARRLKILKEQTVPKYRHD